MDDLKARADSDPEAALREALLNAVCHKQYQFGVPIQISVYEDRLYVANVGSLPEDWTLEKVNEGVNVHVNDRQKELLSYLVQDPGYTVSQLAEKMQVSRKTIAGYLKALKDNEIIERVGSARNGYWKIVD